VTIEYGTRGYTQENVVAYGEKFIRWMLGFNHWTGQGLWFLMRFIWQNWWFVVMRSRTFKIEIQRFSCFFFFDCGWFVERKMGWQIYICKD
jgi:hypothetical protein